MCFRVRVHACVCVRVRVQTSCGDAKARPGEAGVQQELCVAVATASTWLDAAENQLLSGPVLLS